MQLRAVLYDVSHCPLQPCCNAVDDYHEESRFMPSVLAVRKHNGTSKIFVPIFYIRNF